ncbi:hypothetical protein [Lichenibacterium dinghuense]|uniref:hypothetical protein n=1 Tax=Lichenibacterium dinghuense TaxID=2895977 RepID=UPI001F45AB56|nr:hypothetical protein [Lichenibacterium sp. 6Y81]
MPQRAKRAADRYYSHVGPRFSCCYCDEPAEQVDHATPASWLHYNLHLIEDWRFYSVASCADCNAKAGASFDLTFRERRARIARAVRKENTKLLSAPRWSDDELDEMGSLMVAEIVKAMREKERVKRRLKVLESRSIPEGVPNDMLMRREMAEA